MFTYRLPFFYVRWHFHFWNNFSQHYIERRKEREASEPQFSTMQELTNIIYILYCIFVNDLTGVCTFIILKGEIMDLFGGLTWIFFGNTFVLSAVLSDVSIKIIQRKMKLFLAAQTLCFELNQDPTSHSSPFHSMFSINIQRSLTKCLRMSYVLFGNR